MQLGDDGLILCIEHTLAISVGLALNNHGRKADKMFTSGIGEKCSFLLQGF